MGRSIGVGFEIFLLFFFFFSIFYRFLFLFSQGKGGRGGTGVWGWWRAKSNNTLAGWGVYAYFCQVGVKAEEKGFYFLFKIDKYAL